MLVDSAGDVSICLSLIVLSYGRIALAQDGPDGVHNRNKDNKAWQKPNLKQYLSDKYEIEYVMTDVRYSMASAVSRATSSTRKPHLSISMNMARSLVSLISLKSVATCSSLRCLGSGLGRRSL